DAGSLAWPETICRAVDPACQWDHFPGPILARGPARPAAAGGARGLRPVRVFRRPGLLFERDEAVLARRGSRAGSHPGRFNRPRIATVSAPVCGDGRRPACPSLLLVCLTL